jgi:hypothetical protein
MDEKEQYKLILTEIIKKQAVILGPQIAVLKARGVSGIEVTDDGEVTSINGDPRAMLQAVIDQYVELSGQIVKNALGPIFVKYPGIKEQLEK